MLPPQLSPPLTVGRVPAERLRHWWSSRDYRISPPLPPREYPRPLPPPSPVVSPPAHGLSPWISGGATYRAGYGRFRPSKHPRPLAGGLVLPRRLTPDLPPPLIRPAFAPGKSRPLRAHSGWPPRHGFPHCGVFAPAAPPRSLALVSVPISGAPALTAPPPVFGLAGRYPPANYHDGPCPPILGRIAVDRPRSLSGGKGGPSSTLPLWGGISPSFPGGYPPSRG